MRQTGTLVEWNDDRGFGFVEPAGGGERAFCHISQFTVRSRRPIVGQQLSYQMSRDERGRPCAAQIRPAGLAARPQKQRNAVPSASRVSPWLAVAVSMIFLAIIVVLVVVGRIPWVIPAVYAIASGITLLAYALDKSAAMANRWRTQESTLHLFALLGGWPGAWIAQLQFRHKTKKAAFIATFVLCVIVNLAVLTWLIFKPDTPFAQLLWDISRGLELAADGIHLSNDSPHLGFQENGETLCSTACA
jgi:uncharacterized membrane protein YsdA (DUF1294 family)/cold shock CspA family protein